MEETKVNIKPKITRSSLRLSALDNLKEATEETRKSSEKLKRIFERNTYQKKTQLTVLRRYKRRLDAIEREEEERRKRASRRKIKVPQIKKFMGSFFAPAASNDPLKAIGALALFKTGTNLSEGKLLDAFASGLTAAGLIAGPALLGMGINSVFNRSGGQRKPSTGGFKIKNPFKRGPKVTGDAGGFNIINPFRKKSKVTGDVEKFSNMGKAFGRFGKSIVPIAGAALGAADAAIRAKEGDVTGSAIAGTSASLDAYAAASAATGVGLPAAGILSVVSFGLDLVNLVRDLSGASEKEIEKNKKKKKDNKGKTTEDRLKEQTQKQKEEVRGNRSEQEKGPLTFNKTLNGYQKNIEKFEEFSKNFKIYESKRARGYRDNQETDPPPPPPGENLKVETQVVQDAIDFRNQFPLSRGVPKSSRDPYELHMRENEMLYRAGIGNDPETDPVHATGSAHYSDRAIDIPVNSKALGDRVAQFWRSRGYNVLWQVSGHYNHVHVSWNAGSPQERKINQQGNQQKKGAFKGYIITPGHASGGGTKGEKEFVKRLAKESYDKIRKQNPNAPVMLMDMDQTFADSDKGWEAQRKWYEQREAEGYEVLEIHMDQPGGRAGVIRSHKGQSKVSDAWINSGNYAFPKDWRSKPGEAPLAGPSRGIDIFELGPMKSGRYTQREVDSLIKPLVDSILKSVPQNNRRQSSVQQPTTTSFVLNKESDNNFISMAQYRSFG